MTAKKKLRVVFMGTPEFAVPALDAIIKAGYDVVGVITATDKYGGRGGKKLIQSDVKKYAVDAGLKVLQPKNLKSKAFVAELASLRADIQIVVAFRMLPVVVWDMPPLGTYNLHGSLLPKYRGAAPIHWAVINGEKETGVTFFKLKHEIDTGDVLLRKKTNIDHTETTGDVYNRLKGIGAEAIVEGLNKIAQGEINLLPQVEAEVTKAPKIFKDTCEIDWTRNAKEIYNFIRGMNPFPTAWTTLDDVSCKIHWAEAVEEAHNIEPGKYTTDNKSYLRIYCSDGYLDIHTLQMQGRKRMDIKSLLNGYTF